MATLCGQVKVMAVLCVWMTEGYLEWAGDSDGYLERAGEISFILCGRVTM